MIDVGAHVPTITLPDTDGAQVQVAGERGLALVVFLPVAFSPVCTAEVGSLVGAMPGFAALGVDLVAVSCDSMFSLRAWKESQGLPFPVLSDFWPHGAAARAFGVFDERSGVPARASVLAREGRVVWRATSPGGVARDWDDHRAAIERSR